MFHTIQMSTDMLWSMAWAAKHWTALLTTEAHQRWLTMLTSSLSPCMDFSLTRALTAPLTRISSATWNLRMLASSLALPGGRKLYICKPASALASCISRAEMELLGKHRNFLKVQINNVKLKKTNQNQKPGRKTWLRHWGHSCLGRSGSQVQKETLSVPYLGTCQACPTHEFSLSWVFIPHSLTVPSENLLLRMNLLLLLLSLPKEVWDGVGKNPCEIRKQIGHSGIFKCHQGQCHLATIFTAG